MAERIVRLLMLGSVNDLRFSHPLVDVGSLPRAATSRYYPDLPLLWIEGQDLFTGMPVWVPYETVHTARTVPAANGTGCFLGTTTGLASGNDFLEAVSHALCETVERDAATLHRLRSVEQTALRRIDPRTVDDPDCLAVLHRLQRAGVSVGIWDVTTDIAIPAFRCVIAEPDQAAALAMLKVMRAFLGTNPPPLRVPWKTARTATWEAARRRADRTSAAAPSPAASLTVPARGGPG